MGRFLTRDSWQGNYTRPTSLNKWIYVEDNPLGFVDPLGMSRRSYLIFFPGAGNKSGKPDDNGQNFLDNLQIAINNTGKQINIATIFPYGTGSINQGENSLDVIQEAAFGLDKGVTEAKAIQIWNYVVGGTPFGITTFFNNHRCNYVPEGYNQLNDEVSLNFLGYSGGGQIAYTTAQRLTGRLFVDNLILFGAPWRAYNGTNNIGHIWEVWGEGDLNEWFLDINQNYGGMAYNLTGWRSYNMGFPTSQNVYLPWLDIYQKENVRQDVFGDASINHNSYFSDKKLPNGKSMRDEMINYIINTVGVP